MNDVSQDTEILYGTDTWMSKAHGENQAWTDILQRLHRAIDDALSMCEYEGESRKTQATMTLLHNSYTKFHKLSQRQRQSENEKYSSFGTNPDVNRTDAIPTNASPIASTRLHASKMSDDPTIDALNRLDQEARDLTAGMQNGLSPTHMQIFEDQTKISENASHPYDYSDIATRRESENMGADLQDNALRFHRRTASAGDMPWNFNDSTQSLASNNGNLASEMAHNEDDFGIASPPRARSARSDLHFLSELSLHNDNSPDFDSMNSSASACSEIGFGAHRLFNGRHSTGSQQYRKVNDFAQRNRLITEKHKRSQAEIAAALEKRFNEAKNRKQNFVQSVRSKAASENLKVDEVTFINRLSRDDKRLQIESKLALGGARRDERIDNVRSKAALSNNKAEEIVEAQKRRELRAAQERQLRIADRLAHGARRREEALKRKVKPRVQVDDTDINDAYKTSKVRLDSQQQVTQYCAQTAMVNKDIIGANILTEEQNAYATDETSPPTSHTHVSTTNMGSSVSTVVDKSSTESSLSMVPSTPVSRHSDKIGEQIGHKLVDIKPFNYFADIVFPYGSIAEDILQSIRSRFSISSCSKMDLHSDDRKSMKDTEKLRKKKARKVRASLATLTAQNAIDTVLQFANDSKVSSALSSFPSSNFEKAISYLRQTFQYSKAVQFALAKGSIPSKILVLVAANSVHMSRTPGILPLLNSFSSASADDTSLLPYSHERMPSIVNGLEGVLSLLEAPDEAVVSCAILPETTLQATFAARKRAEKTIQLFFGIGENDSKVDVSAIQSLTDSDSGESSRTLRFTSQVANALRAQGVLHIAASLCCRDLLFSHPHVVILALRVLILACSLPSNCEYLLRCHMFAHVVDTLNVALDHLPMGAMGAYAHLVNHRKYRSDNPSSAPRTPPRTPNSTESGARSEASPKLQKDELAQGQSHSLDIVATQSSEIAVVMASFQFLWLLRRHIQIMDSHARVNSINGQHQDNSQHANATSQIGDLLIKYCIQTNTFQRVTHMFTLLRSGPTLIAFTPLVHIGFAFVVAMADYPSGRVKSLLSETKDGELMARVLRETSVAGIASLLCTVLLSLTPDNRARARSRVEAATLIEAGNTNITQSTTTTFSNSHHTDNVRTAGLDSYAHSLFLLPESAVKTSVLAIKAINAALRLDLTGTQSNLLTTGADIETYHIIDILLGHVACALYHVYEHDAPGTSAELIDELFAELLYMIGGLALTNSKMKELVRWGHQPTPLHRICHLRAQIWEKRSSIDIVLPTLMCCIENDSANAMIALQELPECWLKPLLRQHIEQKQKFTLHEATDISSELPPQFKAAHRLTTDLQVVVTYFLQVWMDKHS